MKAYLDLLRDVLENGEEKTDRTGTGTLAVVGRQMRFDLRNGNLPAVTTKKMHFKSFIHELKWMLNGDTNIKYLVDNNVRIWSAWPHAKYVKATGHAISLQDFEQRIRDDANFAEQWGSIGPGYGRQWRAWEHAEYVGDGIIHTYCIDQMAEAIRMLRETPDSRRIIVNSWNVAQIPDMALPPCHMTFQFVVINGKLTCHLLQRSCDIFLGLPANIFFYSLLTHMVAQQTGLIPHEFVWSGVDTHLYLNHIEQAKEQLSREPFPTPTIRFARKPDSIFMYEYDDFIIEGYQSHPTIKAPVAV